MKLRVLAVGGVKPPAARELCDEYFGRIGRYCAVEEKEMAFDFDDIGRTLRGPPHPDQILVPIFQFLLGQFI